MKKTYKHIIGENVNRLRRAAKMKCEDLAKELGVSVSFITLMEKGHRGAKIDNLIKISEYFDVSINDLIKDNDEDGKKTALKKQFIKLGGSNDVDSMRSLKLSVEDFLIDNPDDIQMKNTLCVLSGHLHDICSGDKNAAYSITLPMFESLGFGTMVDSIYDIKLVSASIKYMPHYTEACRIGEMLIDVLDKNFRDESQYRKTLCAIYTNMLTRLLFAKYHEEGTATDYINSLDAEKRKQEQIYVDIDSQFEKHIDATIGLCYEYDFYKSYIINIITKGIFYKNDETKEYGLIMAKMITDSEPNLYEMMQGYVRNYSALDLNNRAESLYYLNA